MDTGVMTAFRHLQRLSCVWEKHPVYFVTACVAGRRKMLGTSRVHECLVGEWAEMRERHGWAVGRYVVMPDHVHFFLAPVPGGARPLSTAVGKWKEWTARSIMRTTGISAPIWQPEFFDHVLRSSESRTEKWNYVRENPVRGGLVLRAEDWPFAGAIDFE